MSRTNTSGRVGRQTFTTVPGVAPAPAATPPPGPAGNFTGTPAPTPAPAPAVNPAVAAAAASAAPVSGDPTATLREEFARVQSEGIAVSNAATAAGRAMTAEERTANDARYSRLLVIQSQLSEAGRFGNLQVPASVYVAPPSSPTPPPGHQQFAAHQQAAGTNGPAGLPGGDLAGRPPTVEQMAAIRDAVNHYIRTGEVRDTFTLTTATGTGVMMPTTVGTPVVVKRIANGLRFALAARGRQVIRTAGAENIAIPVFDDTANTSDVIAQDSTSENNKDPSASGITLGSYLRDSGTVWLSNTLLNSVGFDLLGLIEPMLEARVDVAEAIEWIAAIAAGTVGKTTASVAGVTYPELIAWQHSIPIPKRATGVFLVSDGLQQALRNLTDGGGHLIYQESARDDAPDRLLGWPVTVTDRLATPAAGAVSGVAVAAEDVWIREVSNRRLTRYINIPTHPDQFGMRLFTNSDMKFNTAGVRTLKHAAA